LLKITTEDLSSAIGRKLCWLWLYLIYPESFLISSSLSHIIEIIIIYLPGLGSNPQIFRVFYPDLLYDWSSCGS
jgi:hypothetical protein